MSDEMTCRRSRCTERRSSRQVVLLRPDGSESRRCGPYCDEHTDLLITKFFPTYTGTDAPTYRIDTLSAVSA